MTLEEFCLASGIGKPTLQIWLEEGWLAAGGTRKRTAAPAQSEPECVLSDVDLARARLIRDLIDDIGVNEPAIGIILDLVDQLHGLRAALRQASGAYAAQANALPPGDA
jgi:chaperone modulatory protein CbpM